MNFSIFNSFYIILINIRSNPDPYPYPENKKKMNIVLPLSALYPFRLHLNLKRITYTVTQSLPIKKCCKFKFIK